MLNKLDKIEDALEDIRQGKIVIVVDDEDRENEGDFVAAADMVSSEMINFMATHGRGLICAPILEKRAEELNLEFTYSGGKPSKGKLKNIIDKIPYSSHEIAIIGDRVFTDIIVGNRLGMYTILVDSVDHYGKKIERNNFQSIERFLAKIITGDFL